MKVKILVFLLSVFMFPAFSHAGTDIEVGPWITEVSGNSATILWTTRTPGQAWVELDDGTEVWETFAGRRIFGRIHSVRLSGLQTGSVVRYRIGGLLLADGSDPRDPRFGDSFVDSWHQFRLFDSSATTCDFTMFNDIHMQTRKYGLMAEAIDSAATDFIFLDGDIVSAGNYCIDTLVRYSIAPLGRQANGHPLMFARGNHEGRGDSPALVKQIYPNGGQGFYHGFRVGPVAFLVFDQGETHANRSTDYSGSPVFEDYLNEQYEWACRTVCEPWFKDAPVHVCFIHAGMFDDPDKNGYLLQRWMNKRFMPLLNSAGIDLMLSADLHRFRLDEPGTCGNEFPILTNAKAERLHFQYGDGKISIEIFAPDGQITHSYEIPVTL